MERCLPLLIVQKIKINVTMRYETLQSTKFKMKSHPRLTIWRQELTSPLLLALLLRVQKSAKYLDNLKKKKRISKVYTL